jgi:hypothetical protein
VKVSPSRQTTPAEPPRPKRTPLLIWARLAGDRPLVAELSQSDQQALHRLLSRALDYTTAADAQARRSAGGPGRWSPKSP